MMCLKPQPVFCPPFSPFMLFKPEPLMLFLPYLVKRLDFVPQTMSCPPNYWYHLWFEGDFVVNEVCAVLLWGETRPVESPWHPIACWARWTYTACLLLWFLQEIIFVPLWMKEIYMDCMCKLWSRRWYLIIGCLNVYIAVWQKILLLHGCTNEVQP